MPLAEIKEPASPPLAQATPRRRRKRGHDRQGLPAAQSHPRLPLSTTAPIKRNPCRIKGAGQEESPERPVLTIAQVYALADAVGQRYRALVLLAMFSSLRWGELGGPAPLRHRPGRPHRARRPPAHRDTAAAASTFGPPKSKAGNAHRADPRR